MSEVIEVIRIADIEKPSDRGLIDPEKVEVLVRSIGDIGLHTPPTVLRKGDKLILVAGLKRLEALKRLGKESVECRVLVDETTARRWSGAENVHRIEPDALDKAESIAKFVQDSAHLEQKPKQVDRAHGGRPKGGLSKVCRDHGFDRNAAMRASKISSLPDAVKARVRENGLANNQAALLRLVKADDKDRELDVILEEREQRNVSRKPLKGPYVWQLKKVWNATPEKSRKVFITSIADWLKKEGINVKELEPEMAGKED